MLTGRMNALSRNCRGLLVTSCSRRESSCCSLARKASCLSPSCRADLDVEPAEAGGVYAVARTQEDRCGCRVDHCRPIDRLVRCERIECVDRHFAPLSKIDPALAS